MAEDSRFPLGALGAGQSPFRVERWRLGPPWAVRAWSLLVGVTACAGFSTAACQPGGGVQTDSESPPPASPASPPEPSTATIPLDSTQDTAPLRRLVISGVGDCILGGDQREPRVTAFDAAARRHESSDGWPFAGVSALLSEDDLSIANLEGTLTMRTEPQPGGAFRFRGKPRYANMLSNGGVELVGLTNNHTWDFGEKGFLDTLWALKRAGIGAASEKRPDRRTIRGIEVVTLAPAAGADEASHRAVREQVSAVAQRDNVVVVLFHWGREHSSATEPYQRTLGRTAVDAGADLVLGTHPHVLQGIEEYQGRHIVYSLGNFVFGGNLAPADRDTIIYQEHFALDATGIVSARSEVIPATVSSVPKVNDFRPRILEGADAARVIERLRLLSEGLR